MPKNNKKNKTKQPKNFCFTQYRSASQHQANKLIQHNSLSVLEPQSTLKRHD